MTMMMILISGRELLLSRESGRSTVQYSTVQVEEEADSGKQSSWLFKTCSIDFWLFHFLPSSKIEKTSWDPELFAGGRYTCP